MRQGFAATASEPVTAVGTAPYIIGRRSRQFQLPPDDHHIASTHYALLSVITESTCIDRSTDQASTTTASPCVRTTAVALSPRYSLHRYRAITSIERESSACHHGLAGRWL